MSCSNENSGVWTPMTTRPSSRYACDQARTYGSVRSQLMQVSVQKSTSTTRPRKSAASSGSELSQADAPASDGMCRRSNTLTSVAPAEQLEHEQEDVEDVEEDAGRDRNGALTVGAAQPIEVEDRVA